MTTVGVKESKSVFRVKNII